MSDFTKNQIMVASGTAMAAQANQIPKSVLQLISKAALKKIFGSRFKIHDLRLKVLSLPLSCFLSLPIA
ncbi:MAG: hypothetical protein CM1200mP28_16040 [Deltaproteobacteria bacterium]|nr:MAG: hypothetical protein CM1200mP28_16040 [Deltaproteobacteria bacterium]